MPTLSTRNQSEIGVVASVQTVVENSPSSYGPEETDPPMITRREVAPSSAVNNVLVLTAAENTAENLTPEITDVSEWPLVKPEGSYTSSESTKSRVRVSNGKTKKLLSFSLGNVLSPPSYYEVVSVKPGAYLGWAKAAISSLLTQGGDQEFFRDKTTKIPKTVYSGTQRENIEPNPDCWVAEYDMSGVPIWYSASPVGASGGGSRYGGALLTPQHLFGVWHYKPSIGERVEFLGASGTVYTRTVVGHAFHGSTQSELNLVGDKHVSVLDSPLPSDVKFYPIVGEWERPLEGDEYTVSNFTYQDYWSSVFGFFLNQKRQAKLTSGLRASASSSLVYEGTYNGVAFTGAHGQNIYSYISLPEEITEEFTDHPYWSVGVSGDSGSPIFTPISGGVAIHAFASTPITGEYLREDFANAMIGSADADAISKGNLASPTGYTVTVADNPLS